MADTPDAGWSWVIAFSCSYIHFALFGLFRSAGVIFVALLDNYDTTREEAAWPFSLCSAIFQLTAPIASVASWYLTVRKICLLGSVIATVGISCCYFAKNVLWIVVAYGIVHGFGFGLVAALVPVIVNQYFVRHRATGVGIAFSGGTVSTFIFPVVLEHLLHEYGLQGTFLFLGGVVMNTLVASSMLRAPPWLKRKKKPKPLIQPEKVDDDYNLRPPSFVGDPYIVFNSDQENSCGETNVVHISENPPQKIQNAVESSLIERYNPKSVPFNGNYEYLDLENGKTERPLSQNIDTGTNSSEIDTNRGDNARPQNESSQQSNNFANDKCSIEKIPPESVVLLPRQQAANGRNVLKDPDCASPVAPLIEGKDAIVIKKNCAFGKNPNPLKSTLRRFTVINEVIQVLCHPMFHILTLSMCFFFLSVHTFFMVIVDYAKDKGIPESYAIYVLSVFSATDFVGRAGLGWITDRNYVKRKNMVMINMGIIGILNNFYPTATTMTILFIIAGIHGLAVGSTITLFFVLQAEYLGMKKLPLVIGLASFINGMTTFLRPGMTGLFRDEIGSYDWMFHFLGMLMLSISAAWLFEPWLQKRSKHFDDEDAMSSRFTDIRKSSC